MNRDPFHGKRRFHFVGIGGAGMCALAEIALGLGCEVTGSDVVASERTRRLESLGATIHIGHTAENLPQPETVIASSAIAEDNPEIVAARRKGILVVKRAQMLGGLMRAWTSVAVSGAHGKTTTSAMLTHILQHAGAKPSAVVGGTMAAFQSNALLQSGKAMVVEADESDGSFTHLAPDYAIVTNLDREHTDHYATWKEIEEAYLGFLANVPFTGTVFLNADDDRLRALAGKLSCEVATFGQRKGCDLRVTSIVPEGEGIRFGCMARNRILGEFTLPLPGEHNAMNAAGAMSAALALGIAPEAIQGGLASYPGVKRRFQVLGEANGVTVIDDYAHHPAEITATLAAAARRAGNGSRLLVAFQPHRYTRTQDLWGDFVKALKRSAHLMLVDIYPASEPPIPEITSANLAAAISSHVKVATTPEDAAQQLAQLAQPGDVAILMGAGDISQAGPKLLHLLQEAAS